MAFSLSNWITTNTTLGDAWLASSIVSADGTDITSLAGVAGRNTLSEVAANCPKIQTDSGKRYMNFAGDWLRANGTAADWGFMHRSDQNCYAALAFRIDNSAGSVQMPLMCTGANSGSVSGASFLWDNSSLVQAFRFHISNGSTPTPITGTSNEAPKNVDILLEINFPTNQFSRYLNFVQSAVTATVTATTAPAAQFTLGNLSTLAGSFTGRVYAAMVVNAIPTGRNLSAIRRIFTSAMPSPTVIMKQYNGTILDKSGNPAVRDCILIRDSTNLIIDSTQSLSDGTYELYTQYNEAHTLLFKGESSRNAIVYTGVTPV